MDEGTAGRGGMDPELDRFHKSDTLPDGIAVPRELRAAPAAPTPGPKRASRRTALLVTVAIAGTLGGFVGAATLDWDEDTAPAAKKQPATAPAATPTPTPTPSSTPSTAAPEEEQPPPAEPPPGPVTVNIISSPHQGEFSTYCVTWTGSATGEQRDAVLLGDAPGYQCSAYLVSPREGQAYGPDGVFFEISVDCFTPDSYPAELVLEGQPYLYTCLSDHHGA